MNLIEVINDRIQQQKRFFSIEITPKLDTIIDINAEFKDQSHPLFVSVTWMGDENLKYSNLEESPAVKSALKLSESIPGLIILLNSKV